MNEKENVYISPVRGNTTTFFIYTEREGDETHVLRDFLDIEEFLQVKVRGYFDVRFAEKKKRIYPAYMCFALGVEEFDFVLQRINREQKRQV